MSSIAWIIFWVIYAVSHWELKLGVALTLAINPTGQGDAINQEQHNFLAFKNSKLWLLLPNEPQSQAITYSYDMRRDVNLSVIQIA